jgi:hypothetical protein
MLSLIHSKLTEEQRVRMRMMHALHAARNREERKELKRSKRAKKESAEEARRIQDDIDDLDDPLLHYTEVNMSKKQVTFAETAHVEVPSDRHLGLELLKVIADLQDGVHADTFKAIETIKTLAVAMNKYVKKLEKNQNVVCID